VLQPEGSEYMLILIMVVCVMGILLYGFYLMKQIDDFFSSDKKYDSAVHIGKRHIWFHKDIKAA